MAIHISELNIERYRGVENEKFDAFNHVNIITGNNNSGKTSVLETLCMIGDPQKLSSWFNIAYNTRLGGKSVYTELLRMYPLDDEKTITIDYKNDGICHRIVSSAVEQRTMIPKDELMRLNGYMATGGQRPENKEMLEMNFLSIDMKYDDDVIETGIYEDQNRVVDSVKREESGINTSYISPNESIGGYLEILSNILKDNHYRNIMLKMIQEFDPFIENISLIGDEIFVHSKKHRQAIPLGIFGSGMKKAVYILASIIKNKNGLLMIDEFETGIHEEAIEKVFSMIYELAGEQDVQLFISTHNTEAVKKLFKIDGFEERTNLYTLYNVEGKNVVRRLTGGEIKKAIELGVAIR